MSGAEVRPNVKEATPSVMPLISEVSSILPSFSTRLSSSALKTRLVNPERSEEHELRGRDVIQPGCRADLGPDDHGGAADHVVDEAGSHHAGGVAELLRPGEVDQDRDALLVLRARPGQVLQVPRELVPVRDQGHRVETAGGVLQLDLAHHHGREVGQSCQFPVRRLPRIRAQHAERPETVTVPGGEGSSGIEADAHAGQVAGAVVVFVQQIVNDEAAGVRGHRGARCLVTRHRGLSDADPRLEPLAIAIGQRDGRDRKIEQLHGHAGDAVEGLARRRVEQIQSMQRMQTRIFRRLQHRLPRLSLTSRHLAHGLVNAG